MNKDKGTSTRTALVTGASSGIGLELARLLARDGHDVVLVARRKERLEEVAKEVAGLHGVRADVLQEDLADPHSAHRLFETLQQESRRVDVLVNNAGFGTSGPFAETDLATEEREMQLNMVTLTQLTKLFLRPMLARGRGRIMNVASTAAFQPGPLMAVYYATKAYVLSLTEAVAEEARGSGVTVTAFCPGTTYTEFQSKAGVERAQFLHIGIMDAEEVARVGYAGMMAGKPLVIPGLQNRALSLLVRFIPRRLTRRIVKRLNRPKEARPDHPAPPLEPVSDPDR
jgi:short-subunit dehydrogenase